MKRCICAVLIGCVPGIVFGGGKNHKTHQERPIQLGTSGGSTTDFANGYCCSGTLGALVQDDAGAQYILSNTHVFAGDSTPGGNGKVAKKGDHINQPGYIDVNCDDVKADYVAKLSDWAKLTPDGTSKVDAAIAEVLPGMVDTSGKILEIGTISSTPQSAHVGQKVKKSGRTSGLTKGQIQGLSGTVTVEYTDECGGNSYTTTFHDQILITPGKFLQSGDSGSLMVENKATNPQPIGLLFAGSDSIAIATPIQKVLDHFGVSLVGVAKSRAQKHNALFDEAVRVKTENHDLLMQLPGAVGHAVGMSRDGKTVVIHLLVEKASDELLQLAPQQLSNIPIEVIEVGKIIAY